MRSASRYGLALLAAGAFGLVGCRSRGGAPCAPCAPCPPCRPCRPCRPCPPPVPAAALVAASAAPAAPTATDVVGPVAGRPVLVEAMLLRIPAARAVEVLGTTRATRGLWMEVMAAADAAALAARAHASSGEVLQLPAIVVRSGDEGSIFVGKASAATTSRAPSADRFDAALDDPAWSGRWLYVWPRVQGPDRLAFDVGWILRSPPGTDGNGGTATLFGRTGVATMAGGDALALVLAGGPPAALGDRYLLVSTPRILPVETGVAPSPTR